jgi:hypothetical protein
MRNLSIVATLLTGLLSVTAGCLPPAPISAETTTTYILVRHAERGAGLDPPLNAEGMERAQSLLAALRENGVTAIYTTDLIRNRDTVQPLADALGLTVNLINPALYANTTTAAELVVNQMKANDAGGTILWCGNRGSVVDTPGINTEIYKLLGGTGVSPERYQDLYVMVVREGDAAHVVKAEYGGRSSLDP